MPACTWTCTIDTNSLYVIGYVHVLHIYSVWYMHVATLRLLTFVQPIMEEVSIYICWTHHLHGMSWSVLYSILLQCPPCIALQLPWPLKLLDQDGLNMVKYRLGGIVLCVNTICAIGLLTGLNVHAHHNAFPFCARSFATNICLIYYNMSECMHGNKNNSINSFNQLSGVYGPRNVYMKFINIFLIHRCLKEPL